MVLMVQRAFGISTLILWSGVMKATTVLQCKAQSLVSRTSIKKARLLMILYAPSIFCVTQSEGRNVCWNQQFGEREHLLRQSRLFWDTSGSLAEW